MYDQDYDSALVEWVDAVNRWERGEDPDRDDAAREGIRYYWDWIGGPPEPQVHRPVHTEAAECFQVYETVSEGTPISPVLQSEEEVVRWLIANGDSEDFAREFLRRGGSAEPFVVAGDGTVEKQCILYDK
jgi:hypothetical protein